MEVELLIRVEQSVHRVATRSFTKNQELGRNARKDRRRTRSRQLNGSGDSSSESSFSPETTLQPDQVTPIAPVEKGIEEDRLPKDISREVRKELEQSRQIPNSPVRRVRFDETLVIIPPDLKPDEYDII